MGCISSAPSIDEKDVKTHVDGANTDAIGTDTDIAEGGNYDSEYTLAYSQIKIDYNWVYSTVSQSVIQTLKQLTNEKTELNIIDIGCGDGNMSRLVMDNISYLAKKQIHILGIDISNAQIELATSKSVSNKCN
eukprot:259515_1